LIPIKAKVDDFLIGFDADVANLLNYNMVDTIDTLARTAMDGGQAANTTFVGDTTASGVLSTDIITADLVRQKHAQLAGGDVIPWMGNLYVAAAHPDVTYDLKGETGDGAWIAPHQYVDTSNVYTNEVGTFGGFRWVETSRANLVADGASSTVDLYTSYFFGREHLAKAESIPPHMVVGPVTDKLRRFQPLGWHVYAGWDTLRQASQFLMKSASSIGSNS